MAERTQEKQCKDCLEFKSLDSFAPHPGSRDGRHYYCRACHLERSRLNYQRGLETQKWKFAHLERTYGITRENFRSLVDAQGSKCAICRSDFDLKNSRARYSPCVDHNHTTGKVRGLLCNHCNRGIGLLMDDMGILQSAVKYLETHS